MSWLVTSLPNIGLFAQDFGAWSIYLDMWKWLIFDCDYVLVRSTKFADVKTSESEETQPRLWDISGDIFPDPL